MRKQEIEDFLFCSEEELRLTLNNEIDQKEFRRIIFKNVKGEDIEEEQLGQSNINKVEVWFNEEISEEPENDFSLTKLYDHIKSKLWFSLVIFSKGTEPWDVFMALNSTGLNLDASHLVKSLLVAKINPKNTKAISNSWEKEVVKKVTHGDNTRINTQVTKFLVDFWRAREEKVSKSNLYKFLKRRFEEYEEKGKEGAKEKTKLFTELKENATIYEKIMYYADHEKWWKENYSPEMFNIVCDIKTLNFEQLFPLLLLIHAWIQKNKDNEVKVKKNKDIIIEEFRKITLKGDFPRDVASKITYPLISKVKKGQTLFEFQENNDDYKPFESLILSINKEFSLDNKAEEKRELYELLKTSSKTQNNNVRKFILKFYYFEKYLVVKNMSREMSQSFLSEINVYEAEHLISKVPRKKDKKKYEKFKQVKEDIGNITLVPKKYNGQLSNKTWEESEGKREWFIKMGNECLMNICEEGNENLTKKGILEPEEIEKRTNRILEDLKKRKFLEI